MYNCKSVYKPCPKQYKFKDYSNLNYKSYVSIFSGNLYVYNVNFTKTLTLTAY